MAGHGYLSSSWVLLGATLTLACGGGKDGSSDTPRSGGAAGTTGGTTATGGTQTTGTDPGGAPGTGGTGTDPIGGTAGTAGGAGGASPTGGTTGVGGSTSGGTTGVGGNPSGGTCASWVIRYDLTGEFEIANTALNAGNGKFPIGPGRLVLRLTPTAAPHDYTAQLLEYHMPQRFVQKPVIGGTITTDVVASAGPDVCGVADGTVTDTRLSWGACPANVPADPRQWLPTLPGPGAGCVSPYRSVGNVQCDATSFVCGQGKLAVGANAQNGTWHQPFTPLTFGGGLTTVTMARTQVPNTTGSSTTWLRFDGTEAERRCEAPPTCP